MISLTYLLYLIFWHGMVWGGAWYAVFVLDHSGAWFLLSFLLSACGFKPSTWKELMR